jgi:hypothetical protein
MKKLRNLIIVGILIGILMSCNYSILEKNEFIVVDTLHPAINGFGKVLGYDVIIRMNPSDSLLYSAYIGKHGDLKLVHFPPLKNVKLK